MSSVVAGHPSSTSIRERSPLQALEGLRLFRWYCLVLIPFFGICVGAVLGYFVHRSQPRVFKATALIEVNNREPVRDDSDVLTEQHVQLAAIPQVISSQKILRIAAGNPAIYEQQLFLGMDSAQIVEDLMRPENLTVKILSQSTTSALVELAYSFGGEPKQSAVVLNAIIDAYAEYLSEEWQIRGNRQYNLTTEAQEKLKRQHAQLNKERVQFLERNPQIVFTDLDSYRNPYLPELERLRTESTRIGIEKQKVQAGIEVLNDAVEMDGNIDAALFAVSDLNCLPALNADTDASAKELQDLNSERIDIGIAALTERVAVLALQERRLDSLYVSCRKRAAETSIIINQIRLLDHEMETLGSLLDLYTRKVQDIEFAPAQGRTELKALTLPSIGEYAGPYVSKNVAAGASAAGLPALLFAMMLFYGASGAIAERERRAKAFASLEA